MMGTNGTDGTVHLMFEETSSGGSNGHPESGHGVELDALVNTLAFGIAKELAAAVKQLEQHVGSEVRKLGGAVHEQLQQLATADAELRENNARNAGELEALRNETRDFSSAVSGRFDSTLAAVQESEARHAAGLSALQNATNASLQPVWDRIDHICRDLGSHYENIEATKAALGSVSSSADACAERLNRQADAVRSLNHAWSHRDSELGQIVDVLARLRECPAPQLANEL